MKFADRVKRAKARRRKLKAGDALGRPEEHTPLEHQAAEDMVDKLAEQYKRMYADMVQRVQHYLKSIT